MSGAPPKRFGANPSEVPFPARLAESVGAASAILIRRHAGFSVGSTLVHLLVVLALAGILLAAAAPAVRATLDRLSLDRSADVAEAFMQRARLHAVVRREVLRLRLGPDQVLILFDSEDGPLFIAPLAGDAFVRLDSARLRPATLRYNARGQAAPGSLYLYKGRRGVRLVSNFLGRVRRERFGT